MASYGPQSDSAFTLYLGPLSLCDKKLQFIIINEEFRALNRFYPLWNDNEMGKNICVRKWKIDEDFTFYFQGNKLYNPNVRLVPCNQFRIQIPNSIHASHCVFNKINRISITRSRLKEPPWFKLKISYKKVHNSYVEFKINYRWILWTAHCFEENILMAFWSEIFRLYSSAWSPLWPYFPNFAQNHEAFCQLSSKSANIWFSTNLIQVFTISNQKRNTFICVF